MTIFTRALLDGRVMIYRSHIVRLPSVTMSRARRNGGKLMRVPHVSSTYVGIYAKEVIPYKYIFWFSQSVKKNLKTTQNLWGSAEHNFDRNLFGLFYWTKVVLQ